MSTMRSPEWASTVRKALAHWQSKATLDEDIECQRKMRARFAETLVLGSKNSGASAFVTQMMIRRQPDGISERVLQDCQSLVVAATIESCKALAQCLAYMNHPFGREVEIMFAPKLDGNANDISPDVAGRIDDIWRKPGLQKFILENLYHVEHPVHIAYFLEHVKRVLSQQYFPTPSDILHIDRPFQGPLNITTLESLYTPFIFHEMPLQLLFNSGETTLMVEHVNSFLFFVDMSNYQNILDSMTHLEALGVQGERALSRRRLGFFLNNIKTFERNLQKIPLQTVFPDYTEGAIASKAISYIEGEFRRRAKHPRGNRCQSFVGDVTDPREAEALIGSIEVWLLPDNWGTTQPTYSRYCSSTTTSVGMVQ